MKTELGYYLVPLAGSSVKIPIYGVRALPERIANRGPKGYAETLWQVQVRCSVSKGFVWINQSRRLIVFH
jgi:hypothetical protein